MDAEDRFRALFRRAYPALGRYARNRGLSASDADDLVAGTLEVAWRRIEDVPTDDPLPWLYAVAYNQLRNHRRSAGRRGALLRRLGPPPATSGPEELADPAGPDEAATLRAALESLGDGDQELLRLVAWDELTPSQAAAVLGCSPAAARTRLHRARRRLAAELQRRPGGGQIPEETGHPVGAEEVQ